MMLRAPTLHLWLRPALSANYPRFLTAIDNTAIGEYFELLAEARR